MIVNGAGKCRGLGDTGTIAGDFLDGALTWVDDPNGAIADSLNIVFNRPVIALDAPITAAEYVGFYSVPVIGLLVLIGLAKKVL